VGNLIAKITVEAGVNPGRTFTLKEGEDFTVGRDKSCDYGLPMYTNISRVHCKVENKAGAVSAYDLDSKNGTYVNGKEIRSRALRSGDVVELGRIRLRVHIEEEGAKKSEAKSAGPLIAVLPKPAKIPVAASSPAATVAAAPVQEVAAQPASTEAPVVESPEPGAQQPSEPTSIPRAALELVGMVIADKFKIMSVTGWSGRGTVYKAVEPAKNRLVALKVLDPALSDTPAGLRWFLDGARVAGGLKHDDLVPVLGGGKLNNRYYVASLFMARGSAQQRFRRAPSEGIGLVKIALQSIIHISRVLEFGAQQKIFHRGVRPGKILFDETQNVKLNGLGFDNGPGPGFDPKSPAALYLAPEQFRLPPLADAATDIYGLAATFFYMLTGQPPQRDPKGVIRSPRDFNRVVPDSLCRILERALDLDRAKRYDNHGNLLHDLRWALRGEIWPRS
jgi:hypothetical protein